MRLHCSLAKEGEAEMCSNWRSLPAVAIVVAVVLSVAAPGVAHHGVASLGAAGLEGPGSPVETSTSMTVPGRSWLGYLKLDYASFKLKTPERDDEGHYNAFWMCGLGYGFTSSFSAYLFVPFTSKVVEDNSYNTAGFTDFTLMGVFGFKYDEGWRLIPESESLDDMMDWHFTFYGGLTLPTGDADIRDSEGNIDPGMSLGFGKPAFMFGWTATKQFADPWTFVLDLSYIGFTEYEYADGNKTKFGSELRSNVALVWKAFTSHASKFRCDLILEGNYLDLGRDVTNGEPEEATGGEMLYVQPGIRLYKKAVTVALGIKWPAWTGLNEEENQQGAEGTEDYRVEFTFSTLF